MLVLMNPIPQIGLAQPQTVVTVQFYVGKLYRKFNEVFNPSFL